MRHIFLFVALAACSSAPAPTPCTPGASVPCVCPGVGTGAQVCAADGSSYSACACGADAGGADVVPADRPAAMDAVSEDRPDVWLGTDPAPIEDRPDVVAAPDVVDAGRCPNGTNAVCEGQSVSLQSGVRQDGGVTLHCGACGNTCIAGTFCVACVCER